MHVLLVVVNRCFTFFSLQILFHLLQIHAKIASATDHHDQPSQKVGHMDIELNPDKLDILLHSAALFALLKAKARSLIQTEDDVPSADAVLYARCAADAGTAAQLAKCIVPLLRARDLLRAEKKVWRTRKKAEANEGGGGAESDWMGWPSRMGKWLLDQIVNGAALLKKREYGMMTMKNFKWRRRGEELSAAEHQFGQKKQRRHKMIRKQKQNGRQKARQQSEMAKSAHHWLKRLQKRHVAMATEEAASGQRLLRNIAKLKRVQHFFERVQHCKQYLDGMGEANTEFFSQYFRPPSTQEGSGSSSVGSGPVQFRMRPSSFDSLADELQRVLRNFTFRSFPILSPRLFSLFPDSSSTSTSSADPSLLSPTLFSFHNEGLFALPTLFELVSTSEADVVELLDMMMELAGATRVLDKLLADIEPKRESVERELYPAIRKLERLEARWEAVRRTFTPEQRAQLAQRGYAMMDRTQYRRMYGGGTNSDDLALLDDADLEEDIRRIATMTEHSSRGHRVRRGQVEPGPGQLSTEAELLFRLNSSTNADIRAVRPFVFTNKLRQGPVAINGAVLAPRAFFSSLSSPNFMTLNVLSPVAFYASVLSPRAMAASVLSPTAFTANVLNPNALWSEVLSPKFFHTNVISPRALSALVLAPRTMLAEVLSPKFIEARVLNPGTFFVGVLGPNILQPRVLSPSNFGITVLNPNILSPSILSKGNFTIQVLSPSIMSDDVTPEQLLRGEWQKTNATPPIG